MITSPPYPMTSENVQVLINKTRKDIVQYTAGFIRRKPNLSQDKALIAIPLAVAAPTLALIAEKHTPVI